MKGKTLVISGATRGIGKEIVYRFAKEGVNVAFTYNSNEEIAKEIATDLEEKYNIKAKYYPLNILEPNEYKELFKKIDEDFDRVDFFISNAIISGRSVVGGFAPFMRLKPKGLTNIYTATVLAFVVGAQEAAKRMEKVGGGSIISLSSTGNLVYTPNYAGHGSSKASVETMVK
jgi:7-alpha-hydroxysteroid dehydrogenase